MFTHLSQKRLISYCPFARYLRRTVRILLVHQANAFEIRGSK